MHENTFLLSMLEGDCNLLQNTLNTDGKQERHQRVTLLATFNLYWRF